MAEQQIWPLGEATRAAQKARVSHAPMRENLTTTAF